MTDSSGNPSETTEEQDVDLILSHITDVSKNARATWFAQMLALGFTVIALMSFNDRDFFIAGSTIKLPVIGTEVLPIYYLALGPLLIIAMHFYFHVQLMKLWAEFRELGKIENAETNGIRRRLFPWMIGDFILRQKATPDMPRHGLSRFADVATFFLLWMSTPMVLFWFWWRGMPYHHPWLTTMHGALMLLAGAASLISLRDFLARHHREYRFGRLRFLPTIRFLERRIPTAFVCAIVAWLSIERTVGFVLPDRYELSDGTVDEVIPSFVAEIDLRRAQLTKRGDSWQKFKDWEPNYRNTWKAANGIDAGEPIPVERLREYWRDAIAARRDIVDDLSPPDFSGRRLNNALMAKLFAPGVILTGADLRNSRLVSSVLEVADLRQAEMQRADLSEAEMQGADLRGARLEGAILQEVKLPGARLECWEPRNGEELVCTNLQGAVLWRAEMQGAVLWRAEMQGADLSEAEMQGADLRRAEMQGAVLWRAEMQGAVLSEAEMQGAVLSEAEMQGAVLRRAEMQGAVLSEAEMQGAVLSEAEMQGADLRRAEMQGADLRRAEMQGAVLSEAEMQNAECAGANFSGSPAHSADLTCNNLSQEQLKQVIGDERTVVPPGLYVLSCWVEPPETLEQTLAHYAESFRELVREEWLCDPGEMPRKLKRSTPVPEGVNPRDLAP